jgi:hypothetical protein
VRIDEAKLRETIKRLLIESDVKFSDPNSIIKYNGDILYQDASNLDEFIANLNLGVDVGATGFGQYFETIVSNVAKKGDLSPMTNDTVDLNSGESGNFEFADIATVGDASIATLYSCKMSLTVDQQTGVTKIGTLYKGIKTAQTAPRVKEANFFLPGYVAGWVNSTKSNNISNLGLVLDVLIYQPQPDSGIRILNMPFDSFGMPRIAVISGTDIYFLNSAQALEYLTFKNQKTVETDQVLKTKLFSVKDFDSNEGLGARSAGVLNDNVLIPGYFEAGKGQSVELNYVDDKGANKKETKRPGPNQVFVFLNHQQAGQRLPIGPPVTLGYSSFADFIKGAYSSNKVSYNYSSDTQLPNLGVRKPLTKAQVDSGAIQGMGLKVVAPEKSPWKSPTPGIIPAIGNKIKVGGTEYTRVRNLSNINFTTDPFIEQQHSIILTPYDQDELTELVNISVNTTSSPEEERKLSIALESTGRLIEEFIKGSAEKGDIAKTSSTDTKIPANDPDSFKVSARTGLPTRRKKPFRSSGDQNKPSWLQIVISRIQNAWDNRKLPDEMVVPDDQQKREEIESGMLVIEKSTMELFHAWKRKTINPEPFIIKLLDAIKEKFPDLYNNHLEKTAKEAEEAKEEGMLDDSINVEESLLRKNKLLEQVIEFGIDESYIESIVTSVGDYIINLINEGKGGSIFSFMNEFNILLKNEALKASDISTGPSIDSRDTVNIPDNVEYLFPQQGQHQSQGQVALPAAAESKLYESIIRKLLAASKKRR